MRRKQAQLAVHVAGIVLCVACSTSDASNTPVVESDSAGIAIIETQLSPQAAKEWTLAPQPLLVVSPESDDYQLHAIRDALLTPEGGVAIANAGSQQLLYFDSTGAFVRAVGGPGEGPGEFRGLDDIYECSDYLVLKELRRLSQFTRSGEFVQTWDMPRSSNDEVLNVQGVSSDCGRILVRGTSRLTPPFTKGDVLQPAMSLFWHHRDSHRRDTIAVLDGQAMVVMEIMSMMVPHPQPWRAEPAWALLPEQQLALSDGEHPEVQVLDSAGRVVRIIRWSGEGLTLEHADRELHDRGRAEFLSRYPDHAPLLPELDAIPAIPGSIPALWQIQPDPNGRLWVQTYPRYAGGRPTEFSMLGQSERSAWLIFDEHGVLEGKLSLPVGARLLHVAGDRLALLMQDELDVQRVEVHSLDRPDESD